MKRQTAAEIDPPFDPLALRRVLGHFATGVAVVTADGGAAGMVGMTMSSFNSVSLDPPLVLFSVARSALSLPALRGAEGYGISILGRHQEHLSNRFARPLQDKWGGVEVRRGEGRVPLIAGALAHLECVPYACHEGGDHEVFIARVLRFSAAEGGDPLIFFGGRYHALASGEAERGQASPTS
ncbi:flavin reductase family protein [Xanthobacter pseudotagetidis]|uniref:flavin reductase family protein n=1 Tax=Xanthobacter pseudotagetidis TaxID=3119911 RepID=UPI00372A104E